MRFAATYHQFRQILMFGMLTFVNATTFAQTQPTERNRIADAASYRSWEVPPTPNGLAPNQCWLSISASPDGDIYITGSDHKTNAALYRLDHKTDQLAYVGDARSASEAADNWQPTETAEKFHMRPIFYKGRVYLATADYTDSDDGYLMRRGFHWYCYDPQTGQMNDLSVAEQGGVGGAHASLVAATLDQERGLIYAISTPTCELYRYDIAAGRTENLGCPPCVPEGCHMPGRYIWMGQGGRVYFSVSASDKVQHYDTANGFGEMPEWKIASHNGGALVFRTGAETADNGQAYMADAEGRIYRYDRQSDTFALLGTALSADAKYRCGAGLKMRAFNVSRDGQRVYFINDGAQVSALWEWDEATGETRRLCDMSALDARIGRREFSIHGGNESWGADGCLYFCSFGDAKTTPTSLILSRLDVEKLRSNLCK